MTQADYDIIIRGGTVVHAQGTDRIDIGIRDDRIATLGDLSAASAGQVIAAEDHLVLPGGVDTHCHIEQISGAGLLNADTFETATRSAAMGGTTTVVSFAAQHPGHRMAQVVADYAALAGKGAMVDYAFHMIVSDTGNGNLTEDIPALIDGDHRSIKIFTTYDKVRQDDKSILDLLDLARDRGALVCFHAENDGIIRNATEKLLAAGKTAAKYHAASHPREAEVEAIARMCRFAEYTGARIMMFHVSTREGVDIIRAAKARGVAVQAETCPHYLLMTVDILEQDRAERFLCSPPQRTVDDQAALWDGIRDGTIGLITSDHAPYRMDESGKFANGRDAPFNRIANGMPGLETRLPLMFDSMIHKQGLSLQDFARLTATTPAQSFGLPGKGLIAPGYDADVAVWDPRLTHRYGADDLHDNVGYNPFEGAEVQGMPVTVLSRGRVIVAERRLTGVAGMGQWLAMQRPV